jgi:predicted metal-dependent hydrolase
MKRTNDEWHDLDEMKWAARQWAARVGVNVAQIQIRAMSQKWASISTSGRLTLNSELLDLPRDIGEFVIVHEVLHLIAPSHGVVFKSFLYAYLPNWQELEKQLREAEVFAFRNAGKTRTRCIKKAKNMGDKIGNKK